MSDAYHDPPNVSGGYQDASVPETTTRGFSAPTLLPGALKHDRERLYVVRMTEWEFDQMRLGQAIRLQRCDADTYDAIAVSS